MPDRNSANKQMEISHFGRVRWLDSFVAGLPVSAEIRLDYRILNGLTWRTKEVKRIAGERAAERLLEFLQEGMRNTEVAMPYLIIPSRKGGKPYWLPVIARNMRRVRALKKRPGVTMHWASAPKHPPAVFTGTLLKSGRVSSEEVGQDKYIHRVSFDAPYAEHLEFGTEKIVPRTIVREVVRYWAVKLSAEVARQIRDELRKETGAKLQWE